MREVPRLSKRERVPCHRRHRNVTRDFQRNESLACHRALVQEPLRVASGAFGFSFFGFLVSFL